MRINNNNLQQQFLDYIYWCEINSLEAKDAKSLIAYVKQEIEEDYEEYIYE